MSNETAGVELVRCETEATRAGAYYVRIQAMARKHRIPLEREFDEHDGAGTRYVIALSDFLPVATLRMYDYGEGRVMLGRIVVLEECRGKGLGRAVVTEAEAWARELGYTTSVLEAREGKTGFYEKLGYTANWDDVVVGETFTCIHMEKAL